MASRLQCSGEAAAHEAGEGSHVECCGCLQLFPDSDLLPINAKEQACPECHAEIMRDFRACDE